MPALESLYFRPSDSEQDLSWRCAECRQHYRAFDRPSGADSFLLVTLGQHVLASVCERCVPSVVCQIRALFPEGALPLVGEDAVEVFPTNPDAHRALPRPAA